VRFRKSFPKVVPREDSRLALEAAVRHAKRAARHPSHVDPDAKVAIAFVVEFEGCLEIRSAAIDAVVAVADSANGFLSATVANQHAR